jgi:hypothetical protein
MPRSLWLKIPLKLDNLPRLHLLATLKVKHFQSKRDRVVFYLNMLGLLGEA